MGGGGSPTFFQGKWGSNANFYRNFLELVIYPAPLDPRILTLDLLITSTYISDHAMYLNKRPVYTGLTNKFYQQKRFRSVSFFHFIILKTFMQSKHILNLLKVLREIHRLINVVLWRFGSGSLTLALAFILPTYRYRFYLSPLIYFDLFSVLK